MAGRILVDGNKSKLSLKDLNDRINELLKQSIKSDGVINLFDGVSEGFSLFDPHFLEELSKMKQKNLAVELLRKLIAEQVIVYKRTNVVKADKFSERIQRIMNQYLNAMITNQDVIDELMKLAREIQQSRKDGNELGLSDEALAFYDALTKPEAIKDFYENDELVALTKELTETLRNNKTVDWQKRDAARAKMRMMIKKLLKKYKYPPEGMEDALETVMMQCELWSDNDDNYIEDRLNPYADLVHNIPKNQTEQIEADEEFEIPSIKTNSNEDNKKDEPIISKDDDGSEIISHSHPDF